MLPCIGKSVIRYEEKTACSSACLAQFWSLRMKKHRWNLVDIKYYYSSRFSFTLDPLRATGYVFCLKAWWAGEVALPLHRHRHWHWHACPDTAVLEPIIGLTHDTVVNTYTSHLCMWAHLSTYMKHSWVRRETILSRSTSLFTLRKI